jgi:hypothetical protein
MCLGSLGELSFEEEDFRTGMLRLKLPLQGLFQLKASYTSSLRPQHAALEAASLRPLSAASF